MSDKPSYLGLLNAIANGEGRGRALFEAWCGATDNDELRHTLNVVAIREAEHAAAFTKRICELGFGVRETPDDRFQERLALAGSEASDRKKFRKILGYGKKSEGKDQLGGLFSDPTIDPTTGALLGRFLAEERDSGRRLRAAYEALENDAGGDDPVLSDIADRIDRLSSTLEELKTLRAR